MLSGVVEADETYISGKPKKANKKNQKPTKRGMGTKKTPIIGVVERDGNVIAQVAEDLSGKGIMKFILQSVKPDVKILITDENSIYNGVRDWMVHGVVNHQKEYVNGPFHTNTLEGFWSLLKRTWYGSHHHYKKGYTPLYVAEATWKYNNRGNAKAWDTFMNAVFA